MSFTGHALLSRSTILRLCELGIKVAWGARFGGDLWTATIEHPDLKLLPHSSDGFCGCIEVVIDGDKVRFKKECDV